jgi:hypothetical protein
MRPAPQLAPLDLDTIRRLWKPRRDSYADARLYEANRIRLHRAFSWLERAERCGESQLDDRYLAQWAGLMALASRWDEGRGAPAAERANLASFVRQVFATDHDGVMPATIERERTLVSSMFSDRYLARHFEPVDARALLERRRFDRLAALVLERCALVHAQLAHGGSTYGSRENRTVLKRSSMALDRLSLGALQVFINHGYADDWGGLCWPPARG